MENISIDADNRFARVDVDLDGFLSYGEVEDYMSDGGKVKRDVGLSEEFDKMDEDKDGLISRYEFDN